jgi:hypothetical protein
VNGPGLLRAGLGPQAMADQLKIFILNRKDQLSVAVIWAWSKRVNLYYQKMPLLPRKTKIHASSRGHTPPPGQPCPCNLYQPPLLYTQSTLEWTTTANAVCPILYTVPVVNFPVLLLQCQYTTEVAPVTSCLKQKEKGKLLNLFSKNDYSMLHTQFV